MNNEDFEALIFKRKERISLILSSKAVEYARGDRLSNFKEAAEFLHCTPEKALLGFVTKHMIALRDFVEDLEKGHCASGEQWDEKLGDIINYMILLEALLEERQAVQVPDNRPMSEKVSEALKEMMPPSGIL